VSSGNRLPIRRIWVHSAQVALAFCLAYVCADMALNKFSFSEGWTILWPLNGVTIALLLMRPRSDWPAVLFGVAVGTGIGECLDHNPVGLEIWLRLFSVIEVLASAWLLPPFATLDQWLRKPHIFLRFFAALVLGPGLSGVMAAIVFHHVQGQTYLLAFNDWATADALGIAATMPLALSLRSPEMRSLFERRQLPRTLGVLGLAFAVTVLIFSVSRYPLLFLLYPVLLFVDSLLTFSGAAVAVVGVSLLSVYLTTHSHGPFGVWPHNLWVPRDLALQIYLGFHLLALFPASILFMERRRMAEELRDTNAQLSALASIDGLTGIANRRALDSRFAQMWRWAIRVRAPLALLMIDLDHFKQFNDFYGHHAGDQCLQNVAGVLTSHARRPQDLVARFGGEEFAVLLPHTTLDGARNLAEEIRMATIELAIDHQVSPWGRVTLSIGCAAATPSRGEDRFDLLELADGALYRAKEAGRNCVETSSFADKPVL
jgi:diguanylate cyclase (GGDEF)-like protein